MGISERDMGEPNDASFGGGGGRGGGYSPKKPAAYIEGCGFEGFDQT
jgi:hypothetical protein